ncbi:acyltransferase family protein [Rothia mucilaginosa]|jgi:acyltransferase family domain protein|uniref:acyltransferase family protein n=1 Tax=Rothia mucilaginosa TaxID=43675 RepID=UPI0008A87AB2|nr:acyltransferase family protein [Rothia mucilaginosa]MBF1678183.1 acyltransferase [Rothia sp. (in: high G+C Gram-positive bacteria)]OHQ18693.1 acyltransferase [Rothia sp. HMSC065C03]
MAFNLFQGIRVPKNNTNPPYESFLETRGFRPEIQGLRAFAVLLVVIYHVWVGKVSGGVDVFLFISAFLLSLSFMRKINEGKPLKLLNYWTHVFTRLLPAASVVILLTLAGSFLVLSPTIWSARAVDAQASLFYWQNWNLANNSVNYFASNTGGKSPFLHFWSLSIQGQIFLLWPVLFAITALLVKKVRIKPVPAAVLVFGLVFCASFAFSVWETKNFAAYAYFDTRTRLWEFAVGTLLAIMTLKWKPAHVGIRVVMGWIGTIGLITCGAVLPVEKAFPGFLALWPILSGALVIIAGRTDHKFAIDRLLVSKPLLNLGNISYALYLVHWPMLVLYSAAVGKPRVSFLEGTVLIAASIGLAWVLNRFVEKPLRSASDNFLPALASKLKFKRPVTSYAAWAGNIAFVAAILALVAPTVLGTRALAEQRDAQVINNAMVSVQNDADTYPGARALSPDKELVEADPIPKNATIASLFVPWDTGCKGSYALTHEQLDISCGYTKNASDDAPLFAVVGSSHALQKTEALKGISKQAGANQLNLLLTGCPYPFTQPENTVNGFMKRCIPFTENATAEILTAKPTTVFIISTTTATTAEGETVDPGLDETLRKLTDAGIQVIGIRDNPRFASDMYMCAMKAKNIDDCAEPIEAKYGEDPAAPIFAKYADRGAYQIDLKDVYCPDGKCSVLQGNVYMYADSNHLTNVYEATLTDIIYERALAAGWDPKGTTAK